MRNSRQKALVAAEVPGPILRAHLSHKHGGGGSVQRSLHTLFHEPPILSLQITVCSVVLDGA